ncbi:hypothetical protein EJ02DRAFT_362876, partial [Clathrospora elynae]
DLYLFLDPDTVGPSDHDSCVFSRDCGRKHYGDSRISLAHIDPSWRPWSIVNEGVYDINAKIPGVWVPASVKLESACVTMDVGFLASGSSDRITLEDCSHAVAILDVELPERLPVQNFSDYSWALQRAQLLPSFSSWQTHGENTARDCACAPPYPRLLWSVNDKGVAMAHEDRKAAAAFERAMKTRPQIFQIKATSTESRTRIQVSIHILSLLHRAQGRLTRSGPVTTSWRLLTDHADLAPHPFVKFRLQSNSNDATIKLPTALNYLRGSQPKSLSWMITQEQGRQIGITEVEETVHSGLGWRIEAQAQMTLTVRGGVLADLPSFGKTVTTIGLIQSEFEEHSPKALVQHNQSLTAKLPKLLDSAATLIVCPPHIVLQWQSELKKFLDVEQYKRYNVLVIETYARLQSLTIDDLLGSRVIIVSWIIFADEDYVADLARFTAMPKPATTSRRAFDAWMTRTDDEIPRSLLDLQTQGYQKFQKSSMELIDERMQHPEFQASLPMKIRHGSAYESFGSSALANSNAKGKAQGKKKGAISGVRTHPVPLLHLFRFNRIVVDEYHYLNDEKKIANSLAAISIKHVAALKRWVLSGTPALANFSDIDQIASFLGLKLGRYFFGDGTTTTQVEKVRKSDQTRVEDFLSQTEIMSRQWHQARHERAQEFLDLFVRQNEASLQHISCSEQLLPIELNIAHHTVYLELSQHLISQRMQIKKLSKKLSSDRTDRLNDSLNNSVSAEEALLKSALLFETDNGESGLDLLMTKRTQQSRNAERELLKLLAEFEGLMLLEKQKQKKGEEGITDLYEHFKKDVKHYNSFGDEDASKRVRQLLTKARETPSLKPLSELKGVSAVKREQLMKKRLSQLRELARELTLRMRSERFIESIKNLLKPLTSRSEDTFSCSSPQCEGTATLAQLNLVSHCGHTACEKCLDKRSDDEVCVHPGCNSPVHEINLIRVPDLGTTGTQNAGRDFGNKLETIVQLIKDFPDDDQGIVFAPNEETIGILEMVFDHHNVSYHSTSNCRPAAAAKIMEDFKTNQVPNERKQVLLLNLGSESAAGVNLVNANHVIFLSPFLAKTQYEYDSAMVQAIARSRRYGQQKKVHIYHVVAQRTIDVDILEHRHKRNDGITTSGWTMKMPQATGSKREKTKLIKNDAGQMALVPASWLADEGKRLMLEVGETPDSFTSLINFSEMLDHNGK